MKFFSILFSFVILAVSKPAHADSTRFSVKDLDFKSMTATCLKKTGKKVEIIQNQKLIEVDPSEVSIEGSRVGRDGLLYVYHAWTDHAEVRHVASDPHIHILDLDTNKKRSDFYTTDVRCRGVAYKVYKLEDSGCYYYQKKRSGFAIKKDEKGREHYDLSVCRVKPRDENAYYCSNSSHTTTYRALGRFDIPEGPVLKRCQATQLFRTGFSFNGNKLSFETSTVAFPPIQESENRLKFQACQERYLAHVTSCDVFPERVVIKKKNKAIK